MFNCHIAGLVADSSQFVCVYTAQTTTTPVVDPVLSAVVCLFGLVAFVVISWNANRR